MKPMESLPEKDDLLSTWRDSAPTGNCGEAGTSSLEAKGECHIQVPAQALLCFSSFVKIPERILPEEFVFPNLPRHKQFNDHPQPRQESFCTTMSPIW